MTIKLDIAAARKEAEKELQEEQRDNAKKQLKTKLKQLADAKAVVANLERELEDLEHELSANP